MQVEFNRHTLIVNGIEWDYIDEGSYRRAYRSPDGTLVLKIGEDRSCQAEVEVWKIARRARRFLCPIIASGEESDHSWVIMPYCETPDGPWPDIFETTKELECALRSTEELHYIGDIKWTNTGYYQGNLVVLDYGECSSEAT